MADKDENTPKIIVDSDWKEEARREKEQADRATRDTPAEQELPAPSILEVVQMIIMHATMGLGAAQDPETGRPIPPNLPLAKHYIDLLGLLRDKTADHLDQMETSIIDRTLRELRMAFVQIAGAAAPMPEATEPPQS